MPRPSTTPQASDRGRVGPGCAARGVHLECARARCATEAQYDPRADGGVAAHPCRNAAQLGTRGVKPHHAAQALLTILYCRPDIAKEALTLSDESAA